MYNAKSDPYSILRVDPSASTHDIKRAYRVLAKQYHPDLNPGNKQASEYFADVSKAYELLSNSEQRLKFDRGDIYADGTPRGIRRVIKKRSETTAQKEKASAKQHAKSTDAQKPKTSARGNSRTTYYTNDFAQMHATTSPAPEAQTKLTLTFLEAVKGCQKTLEHGHKKFNVNIPSGSEDGKKLRIKSTTTGRSLEKDLIIELKVMPHAFFTRKSRDIHLDLPISIQEAVEGTKVKVPTIHGEVTIAIPAGANSGTVLRIKNNGIKTPEASGDQFVRLMVMLPDDIDDMLRSFIRMWPSEYGDTVRKRSGIYKK